MTRSNILAGLELDLERPDKCCRIERTPLDVVSGESAAS